MQVDLPMLSAIYDIFIVCCFVPYKTIKNEQEPGKTMQQQQCCKCFYFYECIILFSSDGRIITPLF